ncbi:hypothetical protein EVG20_g11618, partial [Dentipellis fragilis]
MHTHVGSIAAGIVVGLIASCVQSLGLTIQRKSHVLNQALPASQQRVEHRRPLWLLGFAIFITSNILGSLFQIASLPVVILAPLGAVSLLWNAFFARLLLGDVFSPWMIIGTLLIAGGAVLIGLFGIVAEPTHSLDDLLTLFRRPAFVAYFSLLGFAVVVCLVITHLFEFSYTRHLRRVRPITPPLSPMLVATESSTDLHAERTPLLDRKPRSSTASPTHDHDHEHTQVLAVRPSRTAMFLSLSYASHSGTLSGMCLLFAKSGVELLLLTIGGDNQFWRWEAWMLLLGLVAFALLQLWYLHKALILADPTIVCPLAFCFYNLSSIVNGLVYFDQFSLLPTTHLILVIVGIAVLLGGVWVVSFQAGSGVDVGSWNEEDEEEDVEGQEVLVRVDEAEPLVLDIDNASPTHGAPERGRSRLGHGVSVGPIALDRATVSESGVAGRSRSSGGYGTTSPVSDRDVPTSPNALLSPRASRRRRPTLGGRGGRPTRGRWVLDWAVA